MAMPVIPRHEPISGDHMQPNKLVAGIVRRMPTGESVHTVGGVTARMTAAPHVVYLARRTTVRLRGPLAQHPAAMHARGRYPQ
jgi:hypothetical protein